MQETVAQQGLVKTTHQAYSKFAVYQYILSYETTEALGKDSSLMVTLSSIHVQYSYRLLKKRFKINTFLFRMVQPSSNTDDGIGV
jgi:hypothetical protein